MSKKETYIHAGVGKVDITCREEGTMGTLLSEKTKAHIPKEFWDKKIEIDDPLFVRALVLDDGSKKIVIITMDITAVGCRTISQNILSDSADDFMPNLRGRISDELGIPGINVTVCASHTHPPGRLLCDDQAQLDKTLEAVKHALANLEPVTVGIDSGHEDKLTFNRTLKMKNGLDYTVRGCNPFPPDEEVESLRPIDPEIGIIRVDRLDGSPLAVVYNFASHLLIGSQKANITADFPGVTSQYLEKNLGNNAMAFFIQGAGGDIAESTKCDIEQPRNSQIFGNTLGQSVLEAYKKIKPDAANLKVASETVEFPLRTDIPDVIASLKKEQAEATASLRYTALDFKSFLPLYLKYTLHPDFPSHRAYRYMQAEETGNIDFAAMDRRNRLAVEKYLESIANMEKMARNEEKIATLAKHQEIIDELGTATVPAEIQGIKIGESVIISAPMEILAEIGLNVKKASPFKHTYIASIANGYLHYSPPASYYPHGGYEVTECLLAPEWESIFEQTVQKIFKQLK
jgi:hypothetical protein